MTHLLLTAYVLIWPIIAAGVMVVLSIGVWRDVRQARGKGESML
ncbi:MAG: putative transporter small subunit [Neisseriaceae bacterium]|nr:putative transporter small subunit [Neisseriaceae bacterium]MBP6861739.1 putative transporter small subunit [Neisseriaceae bacterium]